MPRAPTSSTPHGATGAEPGQSPRHGPDSDTPPTLKVPTQSPCGAAPTRVDGHPSKAWLGASREPWPPPRLASGAGYVPADVTDCPDPLSPQLRSVLATHASFAGSPPNPEPPRSPSARHQSQPGPLCTFALSRSIPSCVGVSRLTRSRCKESPEVLTSISRRPFVAHQPNLHKILAPVSTFG